MTALARRQLAPLALLFAVGAAIPAALHVFGGDTVMLGARALRPAWASPQP